MIVVCMGSVIVSEFLSTARLFVCEDRAYVDRLGIKPEVSCSPSSMSGRDTPVICVTGQTNTGGN